MRIIAALLAGSTLIAASQRDEPFRSSIDMIRVTATVFGKSGDHVTGLTRDDFRILDDGHEQPITVFSSEPQPQSVAFLIDVSRSMRGSAFECARDAVDRFATEHLGAADEVTACVFNDRIACADRWTRDHRTLATALSNIVPDGPTHLYDAFDPVLERISQAGHRKHVLIVVSDGNDTGSVRSARDARDLLRQAGVLTYAIGFPPSGESGATPPHPFKGVNISALRALTDATGGRALYVPSEKHLVDAMREVATELGRQYQLAYVNPRAADGKYHEIKVSVRRPGVEVRARRGYLAAIRSSS